MQKKAKQSGRERGSALVLALGVLSLLLISATVFIFTANTDREAAAVNADVVKARLMAKGKMESGISLLYFYGMAHVDGNGGDVYDKDLMIFGSPYSRLGTSGDWINFLHRPSGGSVVYNNDLGDALNLKVGFDYSPTSISGIGEPPSWHLFQNNGATVGRAAYLIIYESGKLDVNGALTDAEPYFDRDGDGTYTAGEFFCDIDGDGVYDNTPVDEGAELNSTGSSPQFIDLQNELFGQYTWTGLITGGDIDNFRNLRQGTINRWLSWRQMYAADYGGTPLFVKPPNNTYLLEAKNTIFPRSYDKEAYFDGGTDYHRFSFSAFDVPDVEPAPDADGPGDPGNADGNGWDDTDWDDDGSSDTDAEKVAHIQGTGNWEEWDDTNANYSESIPWLAQMEATLSLDGNATTGEATDHAALRNQVAANIIDYCDSDNIPTHDYGSGKTYCGLEKVPYINEAAVSFAYVYLDPDGTPGNGDDTGTLTINGFVEMINIYNENLTFDESEVTLLVTGYFDDAGTTTSVLTFTAPANSVTMGAGYHVVQLATAGSPINLTGADAVSFDSLQITNVEVVFSGGGNVYDFSVISTDTNTVTLDDTTVAYASAETYDPRCNTVDTMWAWDEDAGTNTLSTTTNFTGGTGTLGAAYAGAVNSNSNPSSPGGGLAGYTTAGTHYDTEIATDPAVGLSTAFIRNAPMQSLWELGAIHRGEPWRTVQLLQYNDGSAAETYVNGDSILLDQCTIGWEKVVQGRLNMNSPLEKAWFPVLRTVNLGAGYDYSAAGTVIPAASVTTITNNIKASTYDWPTRLCGKASRGELADAGALKNGIGGTQTTNATQEEIIGRIAGLLTVRSNFFTILATAQTVKDLGAVPDSVPVADHPSSWSMLAAGQWVDVLAEAKLVAIVYRDAFTNRFVVEDIRFLE